MTVAERVRGRWGFLALLVGSSLLIGFATLTPTGGGGGSVPTDCFLICGSRGLADFIANIVLFLPFGAALGGLGVNARKALLIGAICSLCIEASQLSLIAGRDTNVADIISNSAGTFLGAVIGSRWAAWGALPPRAAGRRLAAYILSLLLLVISTGLLLSPAIPVRSFEVAFTRGGSSYSAYPGRLLEARIGEEALMNGTMVAPETLERFLGGDTISIMVEAVSPEPGLRQVFSLANGPNDVLLLAFDREDLAVMYRSRASSMQLDGPTVRLPDVLHADTAGGLLHLRTRLGPTGFCISAGTREACPSFSAASSWVLVVNVRSFSEWVRSVVDVLWLTVIFLPAGLWFRPTIRGVLSIGILVTGMLIVPSLVGLTSLSLPGWLAAALGATVGYLAGLSRRRVGQIAKS